MHAKSLQSCLTLCPMDVARQAPLSMGFSRQECWSGLPFPPPGDLLDPGIKPASLMSPALAGGFFNTRAIWEALLFFPVSSCKMGHIANSSHGSYPYNSLTRKESEVLPFLTPGKTKENKNKKEQQQKYPQGRKPVGLIWALSLSLGQTLWTQI